MRRLGDSFSSDMQATAEATNFRRTMHQRLVALEERALHAHTRERAARAAAAATTAEAAAACDDVQRLLDGNELIKRALAAEAEWGLREARLPLLGVAVGRVTAEVRLVYRCCIYWSAGCLRPYVVARVLPCVRTLCYVSCNDSPRNGPCFHMHHCLHV
jgi:hypothetical protein